MENQGHSTAFSSSMSQLREVFGFAGGSGLAGIRFVSAERRGMEEPAEPVRSVLPDGPHVTPSPNCRLPVTRGEMVGDRPTQTFHLGNRSCEGHTKIKVGATIIPKGFRSKGLGESGLGRDSTDRQELHGQFCSSLRQNDNYVCSHVPGARLHMETSWRRSGGLVVAD